jgi:hypothetical protein
MPNFTDKDLGYKKFMNAMKLNAGETAGFVGFLRSSGEHKGDSKEPTTVAQVAAWNEFGTSRIPERSFMRSTLAEHSKEIKRLIKKVTGASVDGSMTKAKAIGIVCQKIADGIVAKITSNIPPPNAPETIDRKKSSSTLIDTGQLRNSVDWEVVKGKK